MEGLSRFTAISTMPPKSRRRSTPIPAISQAFTAWRSTAGAMMQIGRSSANIVRSSRRQKRNCFACREARSVLPPCCCFHDAALTVVASVPRALFATGIEQKLNYRRVADSALLNFTDPEVSWFENVFRMPGGSIVELRPGKPRVLRRYYDLLAVPKVHMASDADYMTRASELLDEGVRACIAGFRKPGVISVGRPRQPTDRSPDACWRLARRATAADVHVPSGGRL